jgi:hypothetical protein
MEEEAPAAPAAPAADAAPAALDAELTPEELQMMMAMGIPFVSSTSCGTPAVDAQLRWHAAPCCCCCCRRLMRRRSSPATRVQGFDTTRGKHVEDEGANAGAVKVKTTRTARQFMNRKGGFNRALPAEKTGQKVAGD